MKIQQTRWTEAKGWQPVSPGALHKSAQLVLLFGSRSILKQQEYVDEIKSTYPDSLLFGCSTSGEICGTEVSDDSLIVTAVCFEHTKLRRAQIKISEVDNSFQAGKHLGMSLDKDGLAHVLVLSEGLNVKGSDLVKGLTKHLPASVTVTGGLSGDGERFKETLVFMDNIPCSDAISVLGLYGDRLRVGYGSLGGWDPFGPERLVTRSKGNVLYELDGHSALELYKKYLGEYATGLPATGLLFPLSIRTEAGETGVVRTILSVNEEEQSMTFAGDVPEKCYARLMKANFDRLIDGAAGAAKTSYEAVGSSSPDLAILISCVGRKMALKQRVEEEVEGVRDILGERTVITGFYSYGEISPFTPSARCELHNQDYDNNYALGKLKMERMHNLLKRQIKGFWRDSSYIPEEWKGFVGTVNNAYEEFEADREMLERSLDLVSQELVEKNQQLSVRNKELENAHDELQNANDHLEIKVEERTTDLRRSNEQLLTEVAERRRAERVLQERELQLKKQQSVLIELAKIKILTAGDLKFALQKITEASSLTLAVARVSVWVYNADRSKIKSFDLYELSRNKHLDSIEVSRGEAPNYFKAIEEKECIVAEYAQADPITKELSGVYLSPQDITSLLDVPIRTGGQTVGIVSHEHVGAIRRWSVEDRALLWLSPTSFH